MRRFDDSALPGLHDALDVERVRDRLRDALPDCRDGTLLESVGIHSVQYWPGRGCLILYALKLRRSPGRRSESQWLAAELQPNGGVAAPIPDSLVERYRKLGGRPLRQPLARLPDLGLSACAFPLDPSLPSLLDACDPARMRIELGRLWSDRGVRMRRVDIRPLSYTPHARVALHYETLGEARASGLPEVRHLVGKIDAARDAAACFARNWAIWKAARQRFGLAPPVGYVAGLDLFLQEHIDGQRLSDLADTGAFVGLVRQTARAVAQLHGLQLPLNARRKVNPYLEMVRRWGTMLATIRPQDRRRILALRDRTVADIESRATLTGPIHNDLHPSNVLVSDRRVTLIDLDNMVPGDGLLDIGRFLSALRVSSLRVSGRPDGLAEAGEAFLEHYLAATGEDMRRARLFEAASLLISAGTGFRLQRDGWDRAAELLIDEAERLLGLATRGPSTTGRPSRAEPRPRHPEADRSVVNSAWASDALYAGAMIAPHVRRVYRAELTGCAVSPKAATAQRERLRYALSGRRDGRRWKHALEGIVWRRRSGRRPHRRLGQLHEALAGRSQAPLLPLPIAYIDEIELQLLELPRGTPYLECLLGPDGPAAVDALARALGVLHDTAVELDKTRTVEDELRSLTDRLARLRDGSSVGTTARRLLEGLADLLVDDSATRAPVLRHVTPRRLLLADGRVAVTEVADVALGHPFLDVADFLGHLELAALDGSAPRGLVRLADRFRDAYLRERGKELWRLAAFESVALLRLAAVEAQRDPSGAVVAGLLQSAAARADESGGMERTR